MTSILRLIIFIPLIFIFLQGCVFHIIGNAFYPWAVIVIPFALFFIFASSPTKYLKHLIFLYKKTPFKYLLLLFAWIIITGIIASIRGFYPFYRFLYVAVLGFMFRYIVVSLYPGFIIPKFLSLKSFIKILMISYFLMFSYAIIQFIGAYFNINFLIILSNIISNAQALSIDAVVQEQTAGLPRARGVMVEASELGCFIIINLPIIYSLCLSKYRIFKKSLLNTFMKISIIPLCIISLILTFSPIYILLGMLVSFLYFVKKIIYIIRKNLLTFLILGFITIMIAMGFLTITDIDLSKLFISRIIVIFSAIYRASLEELVIGDGSFATRIVCFIHQFIMFLKHPFTGIGFGNNGVMMVIQMETYGIPLTEELQYRLFRNPTAIPLNTNNFYTLLHQTGFMGVVFYVIYSIKNIQYLNNCKKFFNGIEYQFVNSLSISLIIIFSIAMLYTIDFYMLICVFFQGLVCSIIYISSKRKQ